MDDASTHIGVDLGGTKVLAARIRAGRVEQKEHRLISAGGPAEQVMAELTGAIAAVWEERVSHIGIGVPGLVDPETGMVFDVVNIPSWREVSLRRHLEDLFRVPVFVNNDANCFALGEHRYGEGQGCDDLVGLIIGTGMAAGIITGGALYSGRHCGAGEFGMIPYLDHHYEYYCSGQFFTKVHGLSGAGCYALASQGDARALDIFREYGRHLANGIMAIVYALAPPLIILGGSVSKAFPFFGDALGDHLRSFAYQRLIGELSIRPSAHPDSAVLGAAALGMPF